MEKQYLSVVCKNIGMDIHVRAPIEFEKILDYTFTNSIQMTRQRISIQQLLDQQSEDSSEEDKKQLIRHLNMYSNEIKAVITNHGRRDAFSTGSQNQNPPQPSS